MQLFYVLVILLFVSRAFGALAIRLGQPSLVGELIAGIVLGLALRLPELELLPRLDLIHDETFRALTDLAIFFLMLLAGIELRPEKIKEASLSSTAIAVSGLVLPLAAGLGAGLWLFPESDAKLAQALFLGTALSITAMPVAARVLIDLGKLHSPVGSAIISAALIDDVLGLILLALLTGLLKTGSFPGLMALGELVGGVAAFFAIAWLFGRFVLPYLSHVIELVGGDEMEFSAVLVIGFAYAFLAELLGLHFVIGAFFAGLYFRSPAVLEEEEYHQIRRRIQSLTTGFLAPLFFVSIGLSVAPGAIVEVPMFVVTVTFLAFTTKFVGAAIPAWVTGFSRQESFAIGAGMSGRGAVELIIANIALQANLFSVPEPPPPIVANLFSTIVIMAIVTTLTTPILLRWIFSRSSSTTKTSSRP